ncbi:MAG: mandelate racemase/muconate lactonizing enzyme family protein [Chloroflexi bacterium]|nr:mandelate racemase/muconate lactonizing enzyme family protein [Chloroflexota bacterium]MBV9602927.1 mandelate racemase/muconate lactonizing enzyme family protein [Chloroflexota bacterium]
MVRHRIAAVDVIPVRAEMRTPRGPSILTYHARETLFIKLTTEDGVVGWGETYRLAGAESTIRDVLAPLLIGKEAAPSKALHRQMLAATFENGFAVGGLDLALHDAWGKSLSLPVHELYGGAPRDTVQAYASLPGYYDDKAPEDHWVDEALELQARGFQAMKLRIGRFSPDREMPILARVRGAVGPDLRLMADANAAYSPGLALRAAATLHELNFTWLEEPLPQNGYRGYPELRARMPLPLAGGEGLTTRWAANDMLRRGCFDIIQPDVSICGGIAECLFIGELAQLSQIQCVPHCWAGALTLAATLHVAALLPEPTRMPGVDAPQVELDVTENPFRDVVVRGSPFELRAGALKVPTAPGLGVEIDELALRRYEVT